MNGLGQYVYGVVTEGLLIGALFWVITYITIESTTLWYALRASLIAEMVGNLPYLAGVDGLSPPGILMTVFAFAIFARLIIKTGELPAGKAIYGVSMTYFVLVAMVTCSA